MTDAKEPKVIKGIRGFVETQAAPPFRIERYREILAAYDTLTRERDALKTQLAAARKLMAEAAEDIEYMVNAEYHGPNDVHPAMRAKYTRDMEIVTRIYAALTQGDA
jgi:hypothetical protein